METSFLQKLLSSLEALGVDAESGLPETLLHRLESEESRQALTELIIELFQQWNVHGLNQAQLLGCRDLGDVLQKNILPQEPEVLQRVGHLLGIARALKVLYPYTPTVRDHWVWRENQNLANKIPMEVMLAEGLPGIRRVRALLEKAVKAGGLP